MPQESRASTWMNTRNGNRNEKKMRMNGDTDGREDAKAWDTKEGRGTGVMTKPENERGYGA
jgi:hypothetical protein